jgi:polysaccharide export outer membrane protein
MRTLIVLVALALGTACQTAPFVWVDDLTSSKVSETPAYRIHAGDRVEVSVFKQTDFSVTRTVRSDGRISVPLIGDVLVAGLTPTDASVAISGKMRESELVLDPKVTVSVEGGRQPIATVLGEVKTPGQYVVEPGDNLLQLLGKAGGLSEFASLSAIYVVREGHEPRRIRFSYKKLAGGLGKGLSFRLHDGDVVVVE